LILAVKGQNSADVRLFEFDFGVGVGFIDEGESGCEGEVADGEDDEFTGAIVELWYVFGLSVGGEFQFEGTLVKVIIESLLCSAVEG